MSDSSSDDEDIPASRGNDPPEMVSGIGSFVSLRASDSSTARPQQNCRRNVVDTPLEALAAAALREETRASTAVIVDSSTAQANGRPQMAARSQRRSPTEDAPSANQEPEVSAEDYEADFDQRCREENPNDDSDEDNEDFADEGRTLDEIRKEHLTYYEDILAALEDFDPPPKSMRARKISLVGAPDVLMDGILLARQKTGDQ